jgi:hypothetical protein
MNEALDQNERARRRSLRRDVLVSDRTERLQVGQIREIHVQLDHVLQPRARRSQRPLDVREHLPDLRAGIAAPHDHTGLVDRNLPRNHDHAPAEGDRVAVAVDRRQTVGALVIFQRHRSRD